MRTVDIIQLIKYPNKYRYSFHANVFCCNLVTVAHIFSALLHWHWTNYSRAGDTTLKNMYKYMQSTLLSNIYITTTKQSTTEPYAYFPYSFHWLCKTTFILNTLRPKQCGCQFPDDIFKCFFINWMKMYELRLRFHWSLFLGVTIFQHWFR